MLTDSRVHAALPASDLERARRFYADRLGLVPEGPRAGGLHYRCGGSSFLLFPSDVHDRAGHTQAGFEVGEIESMVAQLRARGVEFEVGPGANAEGISEGPARSRAAWFKDSEGNLLAVVQLG